jgi:hypothetical protein
MDAVLVQLDAFNRRDLEGFLSAYASDVVIEDGAGNVMMRCHDGMRAMYGPLFAQSPDLHAEVVNRIAVGDYVIDAEHTTGFNFPGFPTELHAAVIYHLAAGKIARVRVLM